MSCIHRSSKVMDWISTYDSSSLVSVGPICEDDNGLNGDYSVWQVQCPHFHIISQSPDFQYWSCFRYKFEKTWSTSFHSHISLGWLCNLRFDCSKAFGGFTWLHVVLTAPPMPSQRAPIHSALILKSCLWDHKRSFIKLPRFCLCTPLLTLTSTFFSGTYPLKLSSS